MVHVNVMYVRHWFLSFLQGFNALTLWVR